MAARAAFAPSLVPRLTAALSSSSASSCNFCLLPALHSSWTLVHSGRRFERGSHLRRARRRSRVSGVVRAGGGDEDNLDDEGVVKDMERYLNELAIEYDNVWDTKPGWCQPWTIVLTGVTGITLSWLPLHSTIVTGIVGVLVAAWWFIFLYSYPLAYSEMIAQRRMNQKTGLEDTFGTQRRNN